MDRRLSFTAGSSSETVPLHHQSSHVLQTQLKMSPVTSINRTNLSSYGPTPLGNDDVVIAGKRYVSGCGVGGLRTSSGRHRVYRYPKSGSAVYLVNDRNQILSFDSKTGDFIKRVKVQNPPKLPRQSILNRILVWWYAAGKTRSLIYSNGCSIYRKFLRLERNGDVQVVSKGKWITLPRGKQVSRTAVDAVGLSGSYCIARTGTDAVRLSMNDRYSATFVFDEPDWRTKCNAYPLANAKDFVPGFQLLPKGAVLFPDFKPAPLKINEGRAFTIYLGKGFIYSDGNGRVLVYAGELSTLDYGSGLWWDCELQRGRYFCATPVYFRPEERSKVGNSLVTLIGDGSLVINGQTFQQHQRIDLLIMSVSITREAGSDWTILHDTASGHSEAFCFIEECWGHAQGALTDRPPTSGTLRDVLELRGFPGAFDWGAGLAIQMMLGVVGALLAVISKVPGVKLVWALVVASLYGSFILLTSLLVVASIVAGFIAVFAFVIFILQMVF